jgi:hypothetical protein
MRCCTAVLMALLAATGLLAQETERQGSHDWTALDSGMVVRLHWNDGTQKARLLAPLRPGSSEVRYCRYPSPVCGPSTINPPQARPVADLTRLEVRRGSRTGRGALVGAGVGAVGGLLIILGHGLSDRPALSGGEQFLAVALTAAVWSGLGALVGASLDNWQAVPP